MIYILFFLSGASALIYQLIWLRELGLVFGNTTYATSAILTAFMGGLALGSYIFGKKADKVKSPLRLFAWLELGIGLLAIAILFFFVPVMQAVYKWAFGIALYSWVLNAIRFLLAIIMLIIPTTLMGGTLPAISKYLIKQADRFGKKIGWLYAINTLGGVVGAFFTGYFLIRIFGMTFTYWVAILADLLVAYFAFKLYKRVPRPSKVEKKKKSKEKISSPATLSESGGQIRPYSAKTAKMCLWAFGIAGFASLAYEVVWTRALLFYISSTTYSFTAILVTFLVGIALGSWIMSLFVDRIKNLVLWFGVIEMLIALAAILSIPLIQNQALMQKWMLALFSIENWNHVVAMLFISTFVTLIIPTLLMGAAFPVVNRIYVKSIPQMGQGVGKVYMANTIGSIVGSFLSGFVLLPLLGINFCIVFLAAVNLIIGVGVTFFETGWKEKQKFAYAYSGAAVLLFLVFAFLFGQTKPLFMNSISFTDTKLLYHKDAPSATLSALESRDDINIWGDYVRYVNVNGHNTAHTTFADIVIHKTLAHLPMVLHPDPRSALVVGFGFGSTSKSFLTHNIGAVHCVELLRSEIETAKFFKRHNEGVFRDPRFAYIVNDGRNFIQAINHKYDIISVNAVDPKFSPMIYTTEFYQQCKKKLNSNGMAVAWLPLYGMTVDEVRALMKSFVDAFPNSSLWFNNPEHLLLLGINGDMEISATTVVERMSRPAVKADLAEIELDTPYALLSTFFCSIQNLIQITAGAEAHTDDKPIVEFSHVATSELYPEVYDELIKYKERLFPYLRDIYAMGDMVQVTNLFRYYEDAMGDLIKGLFLYRIYERQAAQYPEEIEKAVKLVTNAIDYQPENTFALMLYADLFRHFDLAKARPYLQRAVEEQPDFAKGHVLLGLECMERTKLDSAIAFFQNAIDINENFANASLNLGIAYAQKQEWPLSEEALTRTVELRPENGFAHSSLSQVLYVQDKFDQAIHHAARSVELFPNQPNFYFNLAMMYRKKGEKDKAIQLFEQGLELAPADERAKSVLQELKSGS